MTTYREFALPAQLIGRRVLWYDRVDSTNTRAAAYADDPGHAGLVVLADEQTAGRGRQGRVWLSPPGCGVLLSVLLFPPESLRRPVVLTALAAVAVCETIFQCARLQATIKWPNDVLVRGRKVCGILVEHGRGTIIGIGLNVNTPAEAFTAAQLAQAGSLALFTGGPLDRRAVAETLITQLDQGYADLREGRAGDLEARWRWHSGLLGRPVVLRSTDGELVRGRLLELAFSGVVLEEPDGQVRCLAPERIEAIKLAGAEPA